MITFEERVQNIADFFGEDDNDVLKERIKLMYFDTRSRLIRQSFSSSGIIDEEYMQAIKVEMERLPNTLDAPYMRTKLPVPEPIRLKNTTSFIYVGDVNMNFPYGYQPFEAFRYIQYNRYNKNAASYTYHDDYIYTINVNPKNILVKAPFYDFNTVNQLSGRVSGDDAVDIATPGDIADMITDMIIQKLSRREDKQYEDVKVDDPERRTQQR